MKELLRKNAITKIPRNYDESSFWILESEFFLDLIQIYAPKQKTLLSVLKLIYHGDQRFNTKARTGHAQEIVGHFGLQTKIEDRIG